MKPRYAYAAVAVWCVVFFALVPSMCAQEATAPRHTGVPQDWSQGQIVFSRDGLAQHPDIMDREPRVLHQAMQRWAAPDFGAFHGTEDVAERLSTSPHKPGIHRDWNVSLGTGRLLLNRFPAKFSIDPSSPPDCANDYVVFGLTTVGTTGGQANLVAFNNLYSDAGGGLCGLAPTVLFAYNITTVIGTAGGRIATSPLLSLDGKKIGFVESVPGSVTPPISASAFFHVLTWHAGDGGTIVAAAAPTMTTLLISSTASSLSSPWVDYGSDSAYVGTNDGKVYKITGVFNGTPALAGGPWPVTVSANYHLTPPVLDSVLGLLMVGSANGNLYQINTTTGAFVPGLVGAVGGTTSGIVAPPIVDITNGTTFVVSANDGTSAVLVEFDTASMTVLAKGRIGLGSAGTPGTALRLYQPAFSNKYYNDPSTGLISLCGTGGTDTTPWQYSFKFTGRTMSTIPSSPTIQLSTSATDRCTGWTEFFNPHVGASPGTDFFFFGLTGDCDTILGGGTTTGCVVAAGTNHASIIYTPAAVTGGPSGIVVDNYSTAAQASSIYFTAGGANTAYKLTQNLLLQ